MAEIGLRDPRALVNADWLEQHLGDPDLRIFDCSTVLDFDTGDDRPYRVVSCQPEHDEGHIPGACWLDLQNNFSRADSPFALTLDAPEKVAAAFERAGVDDSSHVVLYSRRSISWATRFWWMLHWLGFDRASVLDGGFERWQADRRHLSTDACSYPPGHLTINLRPDVFVDRDKVFAAISDADTCLINALGADVFSGENARYGRPGRIPSSINVPKMSLVDPATHRFHAPERIVAILSDAGADGSNRYIAYCGGGIFATTNAFWLYQLGHQQVAVYDNSMSEWGRDESLPMESG
ncbi:MAG: sulfurtransferase [Pseudomonadota bacterium]